MDISLIKATPFVANSQRESFIVANFEAIRRSIENGVRSVAYKTGTLGQEDIEDLIQDSWLDVLTSYQQYNPEKGFKVQTWAGRIAHNNAVDGGKAHTRTATRDIPLEDCMNGIVWKSLQNEILHKTDDSDRADYGSTFYDEDAEKRELVKSVHMYISSLTKRDQLFVKMILDKVSYEDMAQIASCTIATAYNAVYRIRGKLRTFRRSESKYIA